MNNMIQSLYEQKIQSAAQELLANGYQVSIDPLVSNLPFELGGYIPDLIDRFQDIAERVATHPGWRFLLVTLDDTSEKILPSSAGELPSWEELNISLGKLNTLIQDSFLEPAFLYLWSILEAALRKRAITQNIPISRFPTKELLNHAFSSGEISISDFDLFTSYLDVRNRIAHGIVVPIDSKILKLTQSSVQILVGKWSKETS
jgi:hypothetical protein